MPRKLLRVALVAAVLPALTPVMSYAQTATSYRAARPAVTSAATREQKPTLWQRLRGQKPAPVAATPVHRTSSQPVANKLATTRSINSGRVQQISAEVAVPTTQHRTADQGVGKAGQQPTAADFENLFPADVATPVAAEQAAVGTEQQFAAPVQGQIAPTEAAMNAFPISSAAPPRDQNAYYSEPQGTVPQYDRVGMMAPQPVNASPAAQPIPGRPISHPVTGAMPLNGAPVVYGGPGPVRVDGGMYPSPQPHIPFDVGTTMITNPALDPHEMLYAHRYRGLYGPFYHKTYRHWIMTPLGICKSEKRVLVGTEVRVNYKSHISPFSLFFPPVTH